MTIRVDDLLSSEPARAKAKTRLIRTRPAYAVKRLLELAIGPHFLAMCAALEILSHYGARQKFGVYFLGKLRSSDAAQRARAAFALKDLPYQGAFENLRECAAHDPSTDARAWSLYALRELAQERRELVPLSAPTILKATRAESPQVRIAAYSAAFSLGGLNSHRLLKRALHDPDRTIRDVNAPLWAKDLSAQQKSRRPRHRAVRRRRNPSDD